MRKRIARAVGLAAIAVAALGVNAGAARADLLIDKPLTNFGSLPIGTTSAPLPIKFTVTCNLSMACAPDPVRYILAVHGDYEIVSDDCPPFVFGLTMAGESCTAMVTFTPKVIGNRGGLIESGDYHARPDPPLPFTPAPPAEMIGFGFVPGTGGSAATPGGVIGNPYGTPSTAKKKSCKRKRGKAKKRCKRKRR